MQSWQDFLSTQTLSPLLDTDCALSDLSHLGVIRIEGEDKRDFLQGQMTNDIKLLNEQTSQLNSYCTPKGRMLANFRLFQQGEVLFMLIPHERLEVMLKRLRMFVLRSKVVLNDVSDQLTVVELSGDCAATMLSDIPKEINGVTHQKALSMIRIPGDRLRLQLVGNFDAIKTFWQQVAQQTHLVSQQAWRLLDIRAGLLNIYTATAEAFVPQMANMQLIGSVSFTKGCYTGQEVIARMQYLGKLKRRMYRVQITTHQIPKIGDDFYPKDTESTQSIAKIVDIAPVAKDHYEALVIGQIHHIETGDMKLNSAPDALLSCLDLPYPFT